MTLDFIAEVSSNHNRQLERSLEFVDTAADLACSGIKFQLFRIEHLFSREVLARSEKHRQRRDWELPLEFLPVLAERCRERGIQFGCTPFYLEAVSQLEPYVDFYKIASYELLWDQLLTACAETEKPVVVSTGMATLDEAMHACATLRDAGCRQQTLLHCVSGYPAVASDCNLAAIETLRRRCRCPVGWSDHTVDPGVIHRAVHRWEASLIEFHLDLDGNGEEFKLGHCWLPAQIGPVIRHLSSGFAADGDGHKEPREIESGERDWRADPRDGLRPLAHLRKSWRG